jgi:hypothetical protein
MPGDVTLTDTKFYSVVPFQQLRLQVTVGDAQVGGTSLTLNGQEVPIDNTTGVATIGGAGQDLTGSVLNCVTTVRDINPSTNNTSVTHDLQGGKSPESFPFAVSVSADGGRARYVIAFILV